MTKISTVEETLDEVEKYWDTDRTEATRAIMRYASGQRLALLTELRDSGLLEEEKDCEDCNDCESMMSCPRKESHNTLARAIKAHINNLINPTGV